MRYHFRIGFWPEVDCTSASTQLYVRTFFILFLSPLPPGVREGPDCHFTYEIVDFWSDSGPDPGETYDLFPN